MKYQHSGLSNTLVSNDTGELPGWAVVDCHIYLSAHQGRPAPESLVPVATTVQHSMHHQGVDEVQRSIKQGTALGAEPYHLIRCYTDMNDSSLLGMDMSS